MKYLQSYLARVAFRYNDRFEGGMGVGYDSPLRPLKVRNLFEHIDEKIQRRFAKTGRKLYYGRNMGYYEPPHHQAKLEAFFGSWDPHTGIVTFWEHSISVPDIVTEVARIHPIVKAQVEGPFGRE